jgi:hypothetical protein
MRVKITNVPDKNNIRKKIIEYCCKAIEDGYDTHRGLYTSNGVVWNKDESKWIFKTGAYKIIHPIDAIIYYSETTFKPPSIIIEKDIKTINRTYFKQAIAANALGTHSDWIRGFIDGIYYSYRNHTANIYKYDPYRRKTAIGQQARDGFSTGMELDKFIFTYKHSLIYVKDEIVNSHNWTSIIDNFDYFQRCKLCDISCFKNNNNISMEDKYINMTCGEKCMQDLIV